MKTEAPLPILCPTDFSENAARAVSAAAAVAARSHQPLTLLHVADDLSAGAGTQAELDQYLATARDRLQAEARRLTTTDRLAGFELLQGQIAEEEIAKHLEQHPAALIVIGATGRNAIDRLALGNVAENIAESASTPTLVVRDPAPFESWARGERPLRVFVAADFSASSAAALRWIAALEAAGPCEITVACVDSPAQENNRFGIHSAGSFLENSPEVQRLLERDLRERAATILGHEPTAIHVRAGWGRIDAHLIALAATAEADLIVVGTHQRHGLARLRQASISRGLLRRAPVNVACVPAHFAPGGAPAVRRCQRVVAAIDLADGHAAHVLPLAYSLVGSGGQVSLVNVVRPFRFPNPLLGGVPDALPAQGEVAADIAEASARLRELIPADAAAHDIDTEIKVLEDDEPARAICRAAELANAEIVCVGAHRRPGAVARMLGSVALGVLQQCRRPVLVAWPPQP